MADPKAIEFNQPVEEKYGKLVDYEQIIKEPMDLRTITDKLKNRKLEYKTLADWARDVRLVFKNARLYNRHDSSIYLDAVYLSDVYEKTYKELKESLGNPNYDPPLKFEPLVHPIKENTVTVAVEVKEKEKEKHKSKKSKKKKHKSSRKRKSSNGELTWDEREDLVSQIGDLDLDMQTKVYEIISDKPPEKPEDYEVDFGSIPPEKLKKLQEFLKNLPGHSETRKSKKRRKNSSKKDKDKGKEKKEMEIDDL